VIRPIISSWVRALAGALAVLALVLVAKAAVALAVPPLGARVSDSAEIIGAESKARLEATLTAYEKKTGHQLAVLTVPSLEGDPIEDYSMRVVEAWKLGRAGQNDGILLLVAKNDRKMRIEVGYGLEGDLPDAEAGRITRQIMTPRFRAGDYEGGIAAAVDAIMAKTGGDPAPDSAGTASAPRQQNSPSWTWIVVVLIWLFFGGLPMVLIGLVRGIWGGGGSWSSGGGGWSSGSSDSGGGFSGGGGSFGGGGASGSW
jgi:uncharacterized protein